MGTATRSQHDVAVVGARAGRGSLAMLLARPGHDVVVLDRAPLPSDTLSTHSIARSSHLLPERDPAWPRFLAALEAFVGVDRSERA